MGKNNFPLHYILISLLIFLLIGCSDNVNVIKNNILSQGKISVNIIIKEGQLTIKSSPGKIADVNHYTIKLYKSPSNQLIETKILVPPLTDLKFENINSGTYYITAEAFSSSDDSTSITKGGAKQSSNTVTTSGATVTYSSGDKLSVNVELLDGTGGEVKIDITTAFGATNYISELIRTDTGQVVATYDSNTAKIKFTGVYDGTYKVRTDAYYNGGINSAPVKSSTNTVTVADEGDTINYSAGSNLAINIFSNINTIAGTGIGDGEVAASAIVGVPNGVAVDNARNILYINDAINCRIRKLDLGTGIITTFAGTGVKEYNGDAIPANVANVSPNGVALDSAGNIYIADTNNNRIRMIPISDGFYFCQNMTANYIYTIAGNGIGGFSGDGGQATSAQIKYPYKAIIDSTRNILYIADTYNNRVRKVDGNTGIITTVDNALNLPCGVAIDTINNMLYIADNGGGIRIKQINMNTGVKINYVGGLSWVTDVVYYKSGATEEIYFSDAIQHRIRKKNIGTGIITIVAGTGVAGYSAAEDGGLATAAKINKPYGITVDNIGNLYIADSSNNRVRKVSGGVITTIAGNGSLPYGGDGGVATAAILSSAQGIAVDNSNNFYISDTFNNRIRKVTGTTISTIAGDGTAGFTDGTPATSRRVKSPYGIAVDGAGNIYIADTLNHRIRKISGTTISTIAGDGTAGWSDGTPATSKRVNSPYGIAVDGLGNIYIADTLNHRIRKISGTTISTIVGNGTPGYDPVEDGGLATAAKLNLPSGVAVDAAENIYIADKNNHRIRMIPKTNGTYFGQAMTANNIYTIAGNGIAGYSGDGGISTAAKLNSPSGIIVDPAGNIYFVDSFNCVIRKISVTGKITTVVGDGTVGFSGDGNLSSSAKLSNPYGIAMDSSGNIYIADGGNNRIRKVE